MCVYSCLSSNKKSRTWSYNSQHHTNNMKYFSGLSLTWTRREVHIFYLAGEVGKIWRCSCWEKGNFITINEFKCGQVWKNLLSPLNLSLYSTFKQGNLPLNKNVPLVISVRDIVWRLFSPWFSGVHCKNIFTVEHPEPVLVYNTRNADSFPGLFRSTVSWI